MLYIDCTKILYRWNEAKEDLYSFLWSIEETCVILRYQSAPRYSLTKANIGHLISTTVWNKWHRISLEKKYKKKLNSNFIEVTYFTHCKRQIVSRVPVCGSSDKRYRETICRIADNFRCTMASFTLETLKGVSRLKGNV